MGYLCEHDNCRKRASYGFYFQKPIMCKEHKQEGMRTVYKLTTWDIYVNMIIVENELVMDI